MIVLFYIPFYTLGPETFESYYIYHILESEYIFFYYFSYIEVVSTVHFSRHFLID